MSEARRFRGMNNSKDSPDFAQQIQVDITVRGDIVQFQAPGIDFFIIRAVDLRLFLQLATGDQPIPTEEEIARIAAEQIRKIMP